MRMILPSKLNEAGISHLTRLVRMIYYKLGITNDQFTDMHMAAGQTLGLTSDQIASSRGNVRKAITKTSDISWMRFNEAVDGVLEIETVAIIYKGRIRDKITGEVREVIFDSSEPITEADPKFHPGDYDDSI